MTIYEDENFFTIRFEKDEFFDLIVMLLRKLFPKH